MNLGGVQTGTVTFIECPRCERVASLPAGCILRIPAMQVPWCHEIVDPGSGVIVRKGELT